jgi:hypothetical protein
LLALLEGYIVKIAEAEKNFDRQQQKYKELN